MTWILIWTISLVWIFRGKQAKNWPWNKRIIRGPWSCSECIPCFMSVSPYSALLKISSRPSDLVPAKRAYSDHQIDFGLLSKHTKKLKSWIKLKYSKEIYSKSDWVCAELTLVRFQRLFWKTDCKKPIQLKFKSILIFTFWIHQKSMCVWRSFFARQKI